MKYEIKEIGGSGIIDDIPDYELPDNAFSAGQNVRFYDNKVLKFKGHQQVFGANPITPYWATPFNNQTVYYWIIGGQTKLYITDMAGNYINITRQNGGSDVDYASTLDQNWNGGVLNGSIPILNNGVDSPQSWDGNASNRAQDLQYNASQSWNDLSYTCSVIRPFKNYLIALDVTKAGTRYPNMVKWSSSAAAGSVPDTWDESDATQDAGENILTESSGFLIDALPLRDTFIIYGEDSTSGMQYIGGSFIFRFYRLFSDGIMSRRCVKPIKGSHVVLAANDIILHDGQSPRSILDNKRRSWLFNNIDSDNYERSFVVPNYREGEIWFCFPSQGSTLPDQALVWNYEHNTFGVRDLPSAPHIGYGVIDPNSSQIIDDQTQIIDTDDSLIDARGYNPTIYYPLILGTNFYQADQTNQFNGTSMDSYVERTGLTMGTQRQKYISRIIPKMTSTGTVTIRIGSQQYPGDTISWKSYNFTPGADWKIDTRITGRYIGYRIESSSDISWSASSIEFEVQDGGDR